ncbi:alpha/beta hydrolase [Kribbella antibiotica]|uniref:Alpha/beta hydrolase n=1 Tax=Kribbella antibiotica TaxID=190195 RepID=A0A4R4Z581_9ACTN|nr:alpha/beta hydrolase [Kribbella antibiotica]TDD53203.1 alpha/beta hydrolase [Kribbella antibiotica]
MAEFMVDGVRVTYHVHGTGPVCIAHSGGPGVHWPYLRMPWLEDRLTMVYLEPVGTGSSDLQPGGDYSMEVYASYVAKLVEHLGEPKVFLLGHSHGGFVALQTALDYPELLRGVIVYDSMAYNGPELGAQAFANIEKYVASRPAGDALAQQVLDAWNDSPEGHDEELDALGRLLPVYFKDFEAIDPSITEWKKLVDITVDPNRRSDLWDIRPRLGEIAVPVLVIVGTADFICPLNSARELVAGIPGAKLVVFEESGHFAHVEEPELFRDTVRNFVATH